MNEITRIHLAKVPYEIEIEAKKSLEKYLNELKKSTDEEIFTDVEIRITEILSENGVVANGIITVGEVSKIRTQIGEPEVFLGEEIPESAGKKSKIPKSENYWDRLKNKKFFRVSQGSILGGVMTGLAEFFEIDVTLTRIIWFISIFPTSGLTFFIYVSLIFLAPRATSASDILRLRGQEISAENIRKTNLEFDFEKIEKRNSIIRKTLMIALGILSLLAMAGGVFAMIGGNFALNQMISPEVLNTQGYEIFIRVTANVLGILFIVFWGILAKIGFSNKFSKKDGVALIMTFMVGVLTFVATIFGSLYFIQDYRTSFEKSFVVENVASSKFDAVRLSKIKNIEAKTGAKIKYIVSEKNKIEIGEYSLANPKLSNEIKFEIEGETLRISGWEKFKTNWAGGREEVRIYGPELSKIDTATEFNYNLSKNQKSELVVTINLENVGWRAAEFEIDGVGRAENLKLFTRDYSGKIEKYQGNYEDVYENSSEKYY